MSTAAIDDSSAKSVSFRLHQRVQAVFQRHRTVEIAKQLGVNGWVRKNRDEAILSGQSSTVESPVGSCRIGRTDSEEEVRTDGVELTPVEHPTEPADLDMPVRCPRPEPCIVHDGRIWKERLAIARRRMEMMKDRRRKALSVESVIPVSVHSAVSAPENMIRQYLDTSISAPEHVIREFLE